MSLKYGLVKYKSEWFKKRLNSKSSKGRSGRWYQVRGKCCLVNEKVVFFKKKKQLFCLLWVIFYQSLANSSAIWKKSESKILDKTLWEIFLDLLWVYFVWHDFNFCSDKCRNVVLRMCHETILLWNDIVDPISSICSAFSCSHNFR